MIDRSHTKYAISLLNYLLEGVNLHVFVVLDLSSAEGTGQGTGLVMLLEHNK